jgi:hypothetical protein
MKLSENTVNVLKNFASINSGVVLKKGTKQKTISPEKSILVEAILEDQMPVDFGIYDLNQFLGNAVTLNTPDMKFSDDAVVMDNGSFQLNYYSCSQNLIVSPPDKELTMDKPDVEFDLSRDATKTLLQLAALNNLPNLSVIGKNGDVKLQVHEKSNDTSNFAATKIGSNSGDDFVATFKTDNLKLIPDDYHVAISLKGFAIFTNKSGTLKYFIALETK